MFFVLFLQEQIKDIIIIITSSCPLSSRVPHPLNSRPRRPPQGHLPSVVVVHFCLHWLLTPQHPTEECFRASTCAEHPSCRTSRARNLPTTATHLQVRQCREICSIPRSCSRPAVSLVPQSLTSVTKCAVADPHGPPRHVDRELGLSKP
jgi:hypothetical protein